MKCPALEPGSGLAIQACPVPEEALRDRAWGVLLGASLCMFCGQPSVAFYTFGVFIPEIVADTHWSAPAVAGAIGPGALIASFIAPFLGAVSDRLGVRIVAMIGGPAFGLGLALLGLVPNSAATFAAMTMAMWSLSFAGSPVPYAQMLAGWFDKRRGMALSVMFGCGALGIAVWPPYAALLITHLGWREAYVVMGATAGSVILLTALLLLRTAPLARPAAGALAQVPGLLVLEALKTLRFWKIAAVFMLLTGVLAGMAVCFPIVLRQSGVNPQIAASVMSVVGVTMFVGRLSLGLVLDRWFSPHLTIAVTLLPVAGFGILLVSTSPVALFVAAGFLGFGLGSEFNVAAYMVSRAFGLRAFGAIYGLVVLAYGVGSAVGAAVIGALLVAAIGTNMVFLSTIALLLVAIVILLTLRPEDLPFGKPAARR